MVEDAGTRQQGNVFLCRIDQIGIFGACGCRRSDAQNAVLAVNKNILLRRQEVRQQRGDADTQVDVASVG